MTQYYACRNLTIDSAVNPHLYYQIYNWVGVKYKYSGKTKKGIDCSAFVREMYKNVYCINLNGTTRDMFKNITPVCEKDLKEGDLLFFKTRKGRISHVGVYLADNKFAHASIKAGVTVSDLNKEYYRKYFYKGGRLKEQVLKNQ